MNFGYMLCVQCMKNVKETKKMTGIRTQLELIYYDCGTELEGFWMEVLSESPVCGA